MSRPVVALLTDFGTIDTYVGVVKGAVLSVCPDATLVDLTHEIPPHDILSGALHLMTAVPYFPAGTVFLAVVDPGVGTDRRAIAAAAGGRFFVGPDNGLLWPALAASSLETIVGLTNPRYARPAVGRTFEGRDRFGPAAGWLAAGTPLAELGTPETECARLALPEPEVGPGRVVGTVLCVDRFGNLMTNVRPSDLAAAGIVRGAARVRGGSPVRIVSTYGDVSAGEACALVGSAGFVEVAVREGSASAAYGAARGARVEVVPHEGVC